VDSTALDVTCIILAGGKSKRLGRNKVVEVIGRQSLIERVISHLSCFKSDIIVVKGKESVLPELAAYPELKIIDDIFPAKGSLGGLYTGLVSSNTHYNVVVACDMPFVNPELLKYMVGLTGNCDVVIPRINNTLEPLHAVYSRNCISTLEFLIDQDRLSILELFKMVNVKYIESAEVDRFDPRHLSFFNINTEADLVQGKNLVGKEDFKIDKC
jgi:molybdenum cofactor guanylyltransferase